jgi:multidrug efflux system outer membrane protein
VLAYRKAVLSGVADVETALGRLQQSRAGERQAERAASAWKRALRDEQTRQRLGLASGIDTASAEISRADAELNLIGARSRRDMAYVALYKALGGAPPLPKSDDNVSSASEAAH